MVGAHERHTCRVYEVTAKIENGGMGKVCQANDTTLAGDMALDDADQIDEAQCLDREWAEACPR